MTRMDRQEEMMELKQEKDKAILYLEGEMTVKNAAAFREYLLQSLQQSDLVEVNFEAVTAVDLSCLQLLCSAHRSAGEKGKNLVIRKNNVQALYQARSRAGFDFQQVCSLNPSDECLWKSDLEK